MSQFFESIVARLAILFEPQALGTVAADLVANVVIGAITFLAYYAAWRVLDSIARIVTRRLEVDATSRDFTLTVLKFAVLTLAAVNALAAIGVNTASLLTSLGIAGLTLGFAARDALSNLISGLLIYWDRPFVIGDLVEVGPSYGRVERITLRSTRVVTPDGRMLAVPNTEIINTTVASYTNAPHLRIEIPVTVAVDSDIPAVREILLDLVRDTPGYMKTPSPVVVVKQLNDYNVCLELRAWLEDERRHLEARPVLREAVFAALTTAGVDMPFETFRIEPLTVKEVAA
ncbi:MAG: mechanosensitive ion channel family protein [Gemmatimonadota bacterium]|nr:mechanosensitive ion channel family protein [Gemmatimonadota bacterium]MDH3423194.1 mechanosensitive ion channel family protein [Gemmatimonadota bacterium]